MLLVLKYGFKQSRLFNLDCILGNLIDTMKSETLTDTIKTLKDSEKRWQAAISELEEKISTQYALSLLSKRDYTTLELRNKLLVKFSQGSVHFALSKLQAYLRDEDLIKRLITKEINNGSGLGAAGIKMSHDPHHVRIS